jgi:hypothetical protein
MALTESGFRERLRPAPRDGGFRMDDYWVWGASVVPGPDGDYHMFASRWSTGVTFSPGWTSNSHVVRATAPTPEGPFEFAEEVIPPGEAGDWDRMSHNPSVAEHDGTYLLYYYGCSYDGPRPTPADPHGVERTGNAVGLATADHPAGPWEKQGVVVSGETNAVPVVHDDGSVLLYVRDGDFEMSVYEADHWSEAYERVGTHVLAPLEDHAVWYSGATEQYELVAKDMHYHHQDAGYVDSYAGFHATSPTGVEWTVSDPPEAYPHRTTGDRELVVEWDDGTADTFANVERAQVLVEDGEATHLYLAVHEHSEEDEAEAETPADLPSHASWPTDTYNVCVPLAPRGEH